MTNAGLFALSIKAKQNYKFLDDTLNEIEKKFVGNEDFVKDVLMALICGESILVKAPIGSAKELFAKTLAEVTRLNYTFIPLTRESIEPTEESLDSNLILLENYKKAPESIQAFFANLINQKGFYKNKEFISCFEPFMVIATYKEGETFDEESLDKFAISTEIKLTDKYEEMEIMERQTKQNIIQVCQTINSKTIREMQGFVKNIHLDEELKEKVVDFVRYLRTNTKSVITPRTSVHLILAAKANALFEKRGQLETKDIKDVLLRVFGHRIFEENKEELINNLFSDCFE
ncbi:MAG: MoxR family ATPase [Nanoarchaeota archaeon]|jgi:MoxR-like ATPase|nr:MoxR family ATPase [Nanoarchaeota archaeon]